LSDLAQRSEKERKRFYARRPKRVGDVVAAVIAQQGYAAVQGSHALSTAWEVVAAKVLGEVSIAKQTSVAAMKRGVLEVTVANHIVMQEVNFHRPQLLTAVQTALPDAKIASLRFKVGRLTKR
jgi:predicted nucleic acid-binding Zn ribbon protein